MDDLPDQVISQLVPSTVDGGEGGTGGGEGDTQWTRPTWKIGDLTPVVQLKGTLVEHNISRE